MTMTAESNDNRTAAQRALSIPEILAQIFRWIVHRWGLEYRVLPSGARAYQLLYRGRKALLRCGRVNKVWFAEATRYLWQYPANCIENNLSLLLSKVDPERQKFYASLVQIGFMAPLSVNNCAERNRFLDGAEFSRIRLLRLHMWTVRKRLFLPKIQAPGLEVLEIDPSPCANRRYINRRVGLDLAKRIQVECFLFFFYFYFGCPRVSLVTGS